MEKIYHECWEQELIYQFMTSDRCRKRVYICSPLSEETKEGMAQNMRTARAYMFYAMKKMGVNARAPHAYLPMILCDKEPSDRALALWFGLKLLEESDVLYICGNRLSSGMRGEIAHASHLRMPMVAFDTEVYLEVKKILTQHGCDKRNVRLDRENFLMGVERPTTYGCKEAEEMVQGPEKQQ